MSQGGLPPEGALPDPRAGRWVWSDSGIQPPSTVTVWEDGNPEVGRILGPRGQVLRIVRARKEKEIGFTVGDD